MFIILDEPILAGEQSRYSGMQYIRITVECQGGCEVTRSLPRVSGRPPAHLDVLHWWTEWAQAWGYIPATGAGEEDI